MYKANLHTYIHVASCICDMSISTSDMLVCSSMETKILYSNVSKYSHQSLYSLQIPSVEELIKRMME